MMLNRKLWQAVFGPPGSACSLSFLASRAPLTPLAALRGSDFYTLGGAKIDLTLLSSTNIRKNRSQISTNFGDFFAKTAVFGHQTPPLEGFSTLFRALPAAQPLRLPRRRRIEW